jgi:Tol biopolymer transport system component
MLFEVGEDIPTRLTTGAAAFGSVAWSPDGKRIAYRSGNPLLPGLYVQAVDRSGKEELLFPVGIRRLTVFLGWTNNVVTFGGPEQRRYRALPIDPVGTPVEFPRLMGFEPRLSPDGRTFASINPQGGELFVRPFDLNAQVQSTKSWTVTGNAASYRWSADGKNLYFLDQNGAVFSLPVATSPEFSITGSPEKLFQAPSGFSMPSLPPNDANHRFDVNADGQRFVFLLPN